MSKKQLIRNTFLEKLITLTQGKQQAVLVIAIFDESGSMVMNKQAAIDALNKFKNNLKDADDDVLYLLTIIAFADNSRVMIPLTKVSQIDDITRRDYLPDGLTRLWRTVHESICGLTTLLKQANKATGCHIKSQICIVTDGDDNQSNRDEKKEKTPYPEKLQKYMKETLAHKDINVMTIALGLSKEKVCRGLGTPDDGDQAIQVNATRAGLMTCSNSMSHSTLASFSGGPIYKPKVDDDDDYERDD